MIKPLWSQQTQQLTEHSDSVKTKGARVCTGLDEMILSPTLMILNCDIHALQCSKDLPGAELNTASGRFVSRHRYRQTISRAIHLRKRHCDYPSALSSARIHIAICGCLLANRTKNTESNLVSIKSFGHMWVPGQQVGRPMGLRQTQRIF